MEKILKTWSLMFVAVLLFSTAISVPEQIDNVTLRMEWNIPDEGETEEYVEGEEVDGYGEETDLEYPYIVSQTASQTDIVAGIVNFGNFQRLEYDISESVESSMTQKISQETPSAEFLLPFSRGTYQDIENRKENIGEGYHNNPDIFRYANPNFVNRLVESKIIRTILRYDKDDINLEGEESIRRSTNLNIVNTGRDEDGVTTIEIKN